MSRIEELLENSSEKFRTLTVKVSTEQADSLKGIAKKLGMSRTKLVHELFFSGLEELNKKVSPGE